MSRERISQVAYCCGGKYWRWRYPDRDFPVGHEFCCECGERLNWKSSGSSNRCATLRYYYRKRSAFLISGLNTRGKEYQRNPNVTARDRPAHYRRVNREKYRRRAKRFLELGLTVRGTPRRNMPPMEQAWRAFRSGMDVPVSEFLTPLERSEQ